MRQIKIMVGIGCAVCALSVATASALAMEFTASPLGAKTKARSIEGQSQRFEFGTHLVIECEKATGTGTVTESPSPTFSTTVKYSKCVRVHGPEGYNEDLHARFLGSVEYEYHNNGFVELQGEVEIKVAGLKCLIDWPSQTIPIKAEIDPENPFSAAIYSNQSVATTKLKRFPSGFQQKLTIANEFKGMTWEVTEGDCEEWAKIEGKAGKYNGSFTAEAVGGDLAFQ